MATVPPDFAVALWSARHGALPIGIDLQAGQALVLSSRRARAHTTEDLLRLIQPHDLGEGETR